jgi:hypothetical protein
MKKLFIGAAILGSLVSIVGSNTEASNEPSHLLCANNLDDVETYRFTNNELPVGLFSTDSSGVTMGLQIYANSKDEFGLFRSAGNFANHTTVSFCRIDGRTVLKTAEGEFFEYYLDQGQLFLSSDEVDPKDLGEQTFSNFDKLDPSLITTIND